MSIYDSFFRQLNMEGATDPKVLQNRIFYKMGIFIHDNSKLMVAFGLISCIFMSSLMSLGADWAEGFGEEEVESVNAGRLISERFIMLDKIINLSM